MTPTITSARQKTYHLLIIHDFAKAQKIILEEPEYSIGRDPSNSIVINNPGISREHALLRRVYKDDSNSYAYQVIDGSTSGNASRNGTKVNEVNCQVKELQPGDIILFGSVVSAEYTIIKAAADSAPRRPGGSVAHNNNSDTPIADPHRTLFDLSLMDLDFASLADNPESEKPSEEIPTTLIFLKE